MKKMTFALACASTLALFAESVQALSETGFEGYTTVPFVGDAQNNLAGIALWDDSGSNGGNVRLSKWLYKGATGSQDASTVKAYGGTDNLATPTEFVGGNNYLDLSTEGGTLWRSIDFLTGDASATADFGAAQPVGDGLYIDTMVQFTPTEDGGTPEVTAGVDKLAIWLNVDSASQTTNLMVRCGTLITEGSGMLLNYKDGGAANFVLDAGTVVPGEWYRLTVKVIGLTASSYVGGMQHFMIYLDGVALTCKDGANPFDASFISAKVWDANSQTVKDSALSEDVALAIAAGKVFPSLAYSKTVAATLQAVGFKGSGAIDNLQITAENPITPGPGGDGGDDDPTPVVPGVESTEYETEDAAVKATTAINNNKSTMIVVPDGITNETDKEAYLGYLEAKVVDGTTKVVVGFTPAAVDKFQKQLDTAVGTDTTAEKLTNPDEETATVKNAVPGFYYWIEGGTDVRSIATPGAATLATSPEVELTKPALGDTTKAFFKLKVDVKGPNPTK